MDQPDWPEVARQMQGTIDGLRAELASRQIDVETFREGNQKLRAELAVRKTRISELAKQCVGLEDDCAAKDARIAELAEANDHLHNLCAEKHARAERAEAEIKTHVIAVAVSTHRAEEAEAEWDAMMEVCVGVDKVASMEEEIGFSKDWTPMWIDTVTRARAVLVASSAGEKT